MTPTSFEVAAAVPLSEGYQIFKDSVKSTVVSLRQMVKYSDIYRTYTEIMAGYPNELKQM